MAQEMLTHEQAVKRDVSEAIAAHKEQKRLYQESFLPVACPGCSEFGECKCKVEVVSL
jgi:hypothetical protein